MRSFEVAVLVKQVAFPWQDCISRRTSLWIYKGQNYHQMAETYYGDGGDRTIASRQLKSYEVNLSNYDLELKLPWRELTWRQRKMVGELLKAYDTTIQYHPARLMCTSEGSKVCTKARWEIHMWSKAEDFMDFQLLVSALLLTENAHDAQFGWLLIRGLHKSAHDSLTYSEVTMVLVSWRRLLRRRKSLELASTQKHFILKPMVSHRRTIQTLEDMSEWLVLGMDGYKMVEHSILLDEVGERLMNSGAHREITKENIVAALLRRTERG
ncbi:hypothetical protein Tco_0538427 [Tanacetum coccineum]